MLRRRANIEAADYQRRTPLYYAGQHGHKDIVELLLRRGNVDGPSPSGLTPKLYTRGNLSTVWKEKLLLVITHKAAQSHTATFPPIVLC